jgi:excisionase family DNA binding protein
MEEALLSVEQVASILKIHQLTVRRYIKQGRLQALKLGGNIRIPKSALDNFSQSASTIFQPSKKLNKLQSTKLFEITDPIFKLRAKGLSLKPTE